MRYGRLLNASILRIIQIIPNVSFSRRGVKPSPPALERQLPLEFNLLRWGVAMGTWAQVGQRLWPPSSSKKPGRKYDASLTDAHAGVSARDIDPVCLVSSGIYTQKQCDLDTSSRLKRDRGSGLNM